MEIGLSPEIAAMVEQDMARGGYGSAEEYFVKAVELMHEREGWLGETLEEQRANLEESWQQAEQGELISLDEFREEMKEMKAAWVEEQLNLSRSASI